jgi:hypothetical protein
MNGISRNRASSPYDDNTFQTATATSFRDLIHSTPQRHDQMTASQQRMPLHYDQVPSPASVSSDEMSIEIGRGGKRFSYADNDDLSSHATFRLGDENSQLDVMTTPPSMARNSARKVNGSLRKQASLRRATETTKSTEALKRENQSSKTRAVSERLPERSVAPVDSMVLQNTRDLMAANSGRDSRFVPTRFASGNDQLSNSQPVPSRFTLSHGLTQAQSAQPQTTVNNVTVQSTTYTANQSFILPDLPNLTELVSGLRTDGTPVFKRASKTRSRFTSASYRPDPPSYHPIESIALPEDEKAIFASLQLLKDRITQLEAEAGEAHKRAEEYVNEIVDLRNQLRLSPHRHDSAMGSDEELRTQEPFKAASGKIHASMKTLQERVDRSERKTSVAEITIKRITNERDALIAQIGSAYFRNEELAKENEEFRESFSRLQEENEDLKAANTELRHANERLQKAARSKPSRSQGSNQLRSAETEAAKDVDPTKDSRRNVNSSVETVHDQSINTQSVFTAPGGLAMTRRRSTSRSRKSFAAQTENDSVESLATRIEEEIQKYRAKAANKKNETARSLNPTARDSSQPGQQRRSSSNEHQVEAASLPRRPSMSKSEADFSEAESTTTLNVMARTRPRSSQATVKQNNAQIEGKEYTVLSPWQTGEIIDLAKMRQKIEEELRNGHAVKQPSALAYTERDQTTRSVSLPKLPRKSSLKDLTARTNGGLTVNDSLAADQTRMSKNVRVQSPHTSDEISHVAHSDLASGDVSVLSTASRRPRRGASLGEETSAFLIPDITLNISSTQDQNCINHNMAQCTACPRNPAAEEPSIPMPVPVTDRDLDLTNATIRPSQSPELALATVIKHLEDEITHLKIQRETANRLYNQHEPALSRRRRLDVKAKLDSLTAEIEKRSDQVYALYDVLEGQKQQQANDKTQLAPSMTEGEVNNTLTSIGLNPAELSGHIARSAPSVGLDGADDISYAEDEYDEDLPWEGISDVGSLPGDA